jgi:hypothetical protein
LTFRTNVAAFGLIASFSSILLALVFEPGPHSIAPLVLSNIFQVSGEGMVCYSPGRCLQQCMAPVQLGTDRSHLRIMQWEAAWGCWTTNLFCKTLTMRAHCA